MNKKITRRNFLKIAAATSAVAIPAVGGYGVVRSATGEYPLEEQPYANPSPHQLSKKNTNKGRPILVLVNDDSNNPFGSYLSEILTAEGLLGYDESSLSELRDLDLKKNLELKILLCEKAEGLLLEHLLHLNYQQ